MFSRSLASSMLLGATAAALVACAGKSLPSSSPSSAAPVAAGADPTGMPPNPRAEIDRLSKEIDDALAQAGLATPQPPACAQAGTCSATPMALAPIANDATCKPASTQTCTQSCTLATSICDNSDRICKIAGELGGVDAYVNEACERGKEACSAARTRCCGCT